MVHAGADVQFERLAIPDVVLVLPRRYQDARGFFVETWNARTFRENGLDVDFVQDNSSLSRERGTVRGLHFQKAPAGQAKLVRVTRGAVLDVAVDLRGASPYFGRHVSAVLTADAGEQILIPVGFAHGFCTLEPETEVTYKVSSSYSPAHDAGIFWNDPALAIDWRLAGPAILSDKDMNLPRLSDMPAPF